MQRVKSWTTPGAGTASPGTAVSPSASTAQLVSLSMSVSGSAPSLEALANAGMPILTTSQKKRIKSYLKRCRLNPRHTQLNLEGYLLLPVQRVPRYKLLVCSYSTMAGAYSLASSFDSWKNLFGARLHRRTNSWKIHSIGHSQKYPCSPVT